MLQWPIYPFSYIWCLLVRITWPKGQHAVNGELTGRKWDWSHSAEAFINHKTPLAFMPTAQKQEHWFSVSLREKLVCRGICDDLYLQLTLDYISECYKTSGQAESFLLRAVNIKSGLYRLQINSMDFAIVATEPLPCQSNKIAKATILIHTKLMKKKHAFAQ